MRTIVVTDIERQFAREVAGINGFKMISQLEHQKTINELRAKRVAISEQPTGTDELRDENARLKLIAMDHEMADYKGQVAELTSEHMAYISKTDAIILALHDELDELKAKLAALQAQEVAAKYIGTCADGDMIQAYVDLRKGTELFLAAGAVPGQPMAHQVERLEAELKLEKADYAIYRDYARIQREKLRDQIKELESKLSASQSQ